LRDFDRFAIVFGKIVLFVEYKNLK